MHHFFLIFILSFAKEGKFKKIIYFFLNVRGFHILLCYFVGSKSIDLKWNRFFIWLLWLFFFFFISHYVYFFMIWHPLKTNFFFFLTHKESSVTFVETSKIMPFVCYFPLCCTHKFGSLQQRFIKNNEEFCVKETIIH
jgi:hypothetical protein